MKQTGSLLRETIETEAHCAKKLDNTKIEAARLIQAAEKDAEKISADNIEQISLYKKNALLSIEQKKETIMQEWKAKSDTRLQSIQETFNAIADILAEETAERIIRYDR